MIKKYGYNWYAIESLHIEVLDNITDAESLGFECMRALIDEDVILNRDFWTSLKTFYALCIIANRNAQRYLSNIAKTTPRFAAEIFNIWPGISWEFIYQWPFKTIMEVLSRRINKLVKNYQEEIELIYHVTAAYKYEVEVWKSLVELREFYNEYFLPNSLTGGGLIILSDGIYTENYRQETLEKIRQKFFRKPIHRNLYRAYETKILEELNRAARKHKQTPVEEFSSRVQASIVGALGSIWLPFSELKNNPPPLKAAVRDFLTKDLLGEKYWQSIKDIAPCENFEDSDAGILHDPSSAHLYLVEQAALRQNRMTGGHGEDWLNSPFVQVPSVCMMCNYDLCRHPRGRICNHEQPGKKIHPDFVKKSRRNWVENWLLNHLDSKLRFNNLSPSHKEVFKPVLLDNKGSLSDAERQAKSRLLKKFFED